MYYLYIIICKQIQTNGLPISNVRSGVRVFLSNKQHPVGSLVFGSLKYPFAK